MFDFPGSPNLNDQYTPAPGGITFVWNGYAWIMKDGPWGGAITLVSGANGIKTVPEPITGTGSVELEIPVTVARGGTGATNNSGARTNLGAVYIGGDTMTGDLTISAATPSLRLNKSVGQANNIWGQRVGVTRWVIVPGSNDPETGTGNTGSDFKIGRYTDAGALIDFPLTIQRTNANVIMPGNIITYGNIYLNNTACLAVYDAGNTVARQAVLMGSDNIIYLGDPNRWTTIRGAQVNMPGTLTVTGTLSTSANLGCNEIQMAGSAVYFRGGGWPNGPYILNDGSNWIAKGGGIYAQNSGGGTYGAFNTSGQVCSLGARPICYNDGSTAIVYRSMDTNWWMYYSSNSTASYHAEVHYFRNWNGSVEFAHIANGDFSTSRVITSRIDIYGGVFYNGYGDNWLYFNGSLRVADFQSQNNVNATGWVGASNGSVSFYNNGGWFYSSVQIRSGGTIQSDGGDVNAAGVLRTNGIYWQNNGGTMYCPWQVQGAQSVLANNDFSNGGVYRRFIERRGARIECMGYDYDWVNPFVSGGYLYMTPDYSGGPYFANDGWWSDSRLKTNIRNSEIDALGLITATPVRTWEWTVEGARLNSAYGCARENTIGLVAQELQETIPVAVVESAWEHKTLFIDWNYIKPYLFRAIQQLAEQNAKLEARIAQLEAR